MYKSLEHFISCLEEEGELRRVNTFVDPILEIAEITDRMAKSPGGGKALLFENTGTDFPVLTNMMGSQKRMSMALGVENIDSIPLRIEALFKSATSPKTSLWDKMKMLPLLTEASKWMPKISSSKGECQQTILLGEEARLSLLPILKSWPCDAGRFVTLPIVNTIDPDTGVRNVGMYRMQVTGEHTTGMHWHLHKTGERHYRAYKNRGERMPISVCVGGDPVYTYSATAPLPDNVDEYLLAGFLRQKAVKLVKCITNDIYVPSDCDFVIEGYVDTCQDKFLEGPFGDHTGFYSLDDLYPEFHVTAITHRKNAVFAATIVGVPPQEDAFIGQATEKIFVAPIRLVMQPEIEDMYLPQAGVAHNIGIVSIRKSYAGQALKLATGMWGAGQMMFNKALLVVAAGTDIRDAEQIAKLLRNADLSKDVLFSRGVLDILDHSTATAGVGGKIAFDLTAERDEKQIKLPQNYALPDFVDAVDDSLASQWGAIILRAKPESCLDIEEFVDKNSIEGINFILVADSAASDLRPEELLWLVSGNTDPQRDIFLSQGMMVVDGRTKAPYREGYPRRVPNVVVSSAETIDKVDRRWEEYGLGGFIESPSKKYSKLIYGSDAEVDIA